MQEFKVNDYITLSLEEGKTVIYIAGEKFQQCKFLLISIPIDEITSFADIESVDEAVERLDYSLEYNQTYYEIPPETEFWGHCSNLQVWVENDYDTRILKSDLAFPILKRLVDAGNLKAQRVFKSEITKRLSSGYYNVIEFLFEQDYIKYLSNKDLWKVIIPSLEKLRRKNYQARWWVYNTELPLLLLRRLVDIGDIQALCLLKEIITEILQTSNVMNIEMLYDGEYINLLSREEFWSVFGVDGLILAEFEKQINITKKKQSKPKKNLCYFILSNGIYINQGPMVFTFNNQHVTGVGVWGDDRRSFQIEKFPDSFYNLKLLESLVLNNIGLKEIPDKIGTLKSLKLLSFSNNQLKNIPNRICNLINIESLSIEWNKIESLPECISKLTHLQELHIFKNPLDIKTRSMLKYLEEEKKINLYLDSY